PAWSVPAGRDDTPSRIRALGSALGLAGEVTAGDGSWTVVDGDRRLEVSDQPGLPWYLADDRTMDRAVSSRLEVAVSAPSVAISDPDRSTSSQTGDGAPGSSPGSPGAPD